MDENLFVIINLGLLGIAGVAALIYFVYLTRKRLGSRYTHPRQKPASKTTTDADKTAKP